jgi:hypothetical protein
MTTLERQMRIAWQGAPYQHFGRCASCGCTHDQDERPLLVCGVNLDSLVCFECFDTEHDGRHPNYRRRQRRAAA